VSDEIYLHDRTVKLVENIRGYQDIPSLWNFVSDRLEIYHWGIPSKYDIKVSEECNLVQL